MLVLHPIPKSRRRFRLSALRLGGLIGSLALSSTPARAKKNGFGLGFGLGFGPASGLGTVLVLASLALASGPARADGFRVEGQIHVDDLLIQGDYRGGSELIAPVPRHGVQVELWSDREPGEFVRVGESVQLRFRTNESCYVTLISIDAEGRARRLFPRRGDDGWVRAGRVEAIPGRWDDYDLRFTGPVGEEYVFAIASRDPLVRYYPAWLSGGWGPSWDECGYRYGRSDLFDTGWCVGDPIPEIYRFAERLVPFPNRYETYAATWIRFDVGRRHAPVWRVCNDCGGLIDHGHDCGRGYIEISIGIGRGVCDFYRPCPPPRYRHVVCRTVEPKRWNRVFREPVGRWRSPGDVDRVDVSPVRSRDGSPKGKSVMTPEDYRRMREEGSREGAVRNRERDARDSDTGNERSVTPAPGSSDDRIGRRQERTRDQVRDQLRETERSQDPGSVSPVPQAEGPKDRRRFEAPGSERRERTKGPEAKSPDSRSSDSRTSDSGSSDSGSSDSKSSGSKSADTKPSDTKPSGAKSSDTRSPRTSADSGSSDNKSSDAAQKSPRSRR